MIEMSRTSRGSKGGTFVTSINPSPYKGLHHAFAAASGNPDLNFHFCIDVLEPTTSRGTRARNSRSAKCQNFGADSENGQGLNQDEASTCTQPT